MNFNIIWIKIFYIDNVIKNVVCAAFYAYIFNFITRFLIYIINA